MAFFYSKIFAKDQINPYIRNSDNEKVIVKHKPTTK